MYICVYISLSASPCIENCEFTSVLPVLILYFKVLSNFLAFHICNYLFRQWETWLLLFLIYLLIWSVSLVCDHLPSPALYPPCGCCLHPTLVHPTLDSHASPQHGGLCFPLSCQTLGSVRGQERREEEIKGKSFSPFSKRFPISSL